MYRKIHLNKSVESKFINFASGDFSHLLISLANNFRVCTISLDETKQISETNITLQDPVHIQCFLPIMAASVTWLKYLPGKKVIFEDFMSYFEVYTQLCFRI